MSARPQGPEGRPIDLPERIGEGEGRGPSQRLGVDVVYRDTGDGFVTGLFRPEPHHAGWEGVCHGGVTAHLVDEALAYVAAGQRGLVGMTLRLEIQYERPLFVGHDYVVRGRVTDRRVGPAVVVEVFVEDAAGPCVRAEAVYRLARAAIVRRLLEQLKGRAEAS
jgi:uncharacterized protein (TIGR00369 family)